MQVELNSYQKYIVRSLVRIQIENLKRLINEDVPEVDVTLECIESGVDKGDLKLLMQKNIRVFAEIMKEPETFLQLPEDYLSILKHILHTHKWGKKKKIKQAKRQVWIKILIHEQTHINLN